MEVYVWCCPWGLEDCYCQECCPDQKGNWDVMKKLIETVAMVPEVDQWRVDYLARLLTGRGETSYMVEDTLVLGLSVLIDGICVNCIDHSC